MTQTQSLDSKASPSRFWRHNALLLAGDVVSFVVFATLGRGSHGEASGIAAPVETLITAAPFLAGWLIAAPLAGAYGQSARATPSAMARRTALAWLLAWPLALGLRALFEQRGIPVSFAIVAGSVNLVFLVGWRTLLTYLIAKAR